MATDIVPEAEREVSSSLSGSKDNVPCAHYVLKAELLIEEGKFDLAAEHLQTFFKENGSSNHFLARAYICRAVLSAPANNTELEELEECTGYIIKVVNMCRKIPPYHFLVFNASVVLWKLVRPFQVCGSRKHLVQTLAVVSKGLEDINDKDDTWRLEIMIALLHSQLECGQLEEAGRTCSKAIHLAKTCGEHRIPEILRLQIVNGLTEGKGSRDDIRADPQLYLLCKVIKLRSTSANLEEGELDVKLNKLLDLVVKEPRTSGVVSGRRTREKLAQSKPITPEIRSPCLVELAELALHHSQHGVATKCMVHFTPEKQTGSVVLRAELVECQLELFQQRDSLYTKSSVEARFAVLSRYCAVMTSAHRLKLASLVEQGAVLLWNAALPLLQHNLRHRLTKPLTQLTLYMELNESLLHLVRCEAHLELAKCLEQSEKPSMAMEHVDKALKLDTSGQYLSVLNQMKHRLQLSSQLYRESEKKLDQATAILEQIKSLPPGHSEHSQPLLVKVGALLDPKHFKKVLHHPPQEVMSHDFTDYLMSLSAKCKDYKQIKMAAELHCEDVGDEDARERCCLWASLAKISRKHEVWDVSLVASRYCLLYNDGRWDFPGMQNLKVESLTVPSKTSAVSQSSLSGRVPSGVPSPKHPSTSSLKEKSQKSLQDSSVASTTAKSVASSEQETKERKTGSGDREMLRLLSTVTCLHGDAIIHLVQSEGLKLFVPPTPPPAARHVRDFDAATNEEWQGYCDWIKELSNDAVVSFLQSAELAVQLKEPWILHNAVVYLWNYSLHLLNGPSVEPLVHHYRVLLRLTKQISEDRDLSVLCGISGHFVAGVLQRWTPVVVEAQRNPPETPSAKKQDKGKNKVPTSLLGLVDPSAEVELKEALKVCEEAVTWGRQLPLPHRQPLLVSWVQLKQILQQSVDKTLGQGAESGSTAHENSVVVAMEMLRSRGGPFGDFTYHPTIKEIVDHMIAANIEDTPTALDLWTGLSELAWKSKDLTQAESCADRAIEVGPGAIELVRKESVDRKIRNKSYKLTPAQCHQMLSLAYSIKGGCLSTKSSSDVSLVKEAKHSLLAAARHGQEGQSYQHVIQVCRLVWNMSCKTVATARGRVSLVPLLLELLEILSSLSSRRRKSLTSGADDCGGLVGTVDDMDLRVSMYSVVLQSYYDRGDWFEGLTVCDEAIQVLPRTHHMDLIRYRIIFKGKLGRAVDGDMVLFGEESEDSLASMWFLVASNAVSERDKMAAFRRAISSIKQTCNGWKKVGYLLEFGMWLYKTHHSKSTALAQFQDALQLVMCLESPDKQKAGASTGEESGTDHHNQEEPDVNPGGSSQPPVLLRDLSPKPLNTIESVSHLLRVLRIFIMMSMVEEEGSKEHKEHLITALDITVILWKYFIKEFSTSKQTLVSGKDGQSTLSPSRERPSTSLLPSTCQQWATFSLTDEMRTAVREGSDVSSINKHTVTSPGLTLHYLQLLVGGLVSYDLHANCFPVLAMQLLIAEEVMENRTLTVLVRMRLLALCRQLQLDAGVTHHKDKMTSSSPYHPEDIAKCEAEIASQRVHEEATAKELSRWQSTRTSKTASNATGLQQAHSGGPGDTDGHEMPDRDGEVFGDEPSLSRVWLEEAKLMMSEGCYNTIHKMLQSAYAAAKASQDHSTVCSVLLCMAQLHCREKMWAKATELILEAQNLPCSLEDCLASYVMLMDVLSSQHLSVDKVVQHGVEVFGKIGSAQCNNRAFSEYATALLKFRMHLLSLEVSPLEVAHLVESVRRMEERGRTGAALLMMEDCLRILRRSLRKMKNGQLSDHKDYHSLQLTFVELSRDFIVSLRDRITFIEKHTACVTMESVSLPVIRCLATTQLHLSAVLADMYTEYTEEQRMRSLKAREKPSVERMIEEYVGESDAPSTKNERWKEVARSGAEHALTLLSSSHSLLLRDHFLLSEVHLVTGQCQLAVANSYSSDVTIQWNRTLYEELAQVCSPRDEVSGEGTEELSEPFPVTKKSYNTLSLVIRGEDAKKDQTDETFFFHYLTKATQSLGQAVTLGLEAQHLDAVREASLMLTDCFGLLDSSSSIQYLALHQSCAVASSLSSMLKDMHSDPAGSQVAATLQMRILSNGERHIPAYIKSSPTLEHTEALRNLKISEDHLTFSKSFPSNIRFIILQHSPARDKLYCGYMLPPQPPPPTAGKKGSTPAPTHVPLEPVVTCCDVSAETLDAILELLSEHNKELLQEVQRKEKVLARRNRQTELMSKPNIDGPFESPEPPMSVDSPHERLPLSDVLAAMEAYLSQAMELIDTAMKREKDNKLTFVILADSYLMQLPLEALTMFSYPCVGAVSRDFSMQTLSCRLQRFSGENAEVDKQPSKTPGKKDKMDKFKPQPQTILASCATTKYFVDMDRSLSHYNQKEYQHLSDGVLSEIQLYPKHTSKWSGITKPDHVPSESDLVQQLTSATGLIYLDEGGVSKWVDPSLLKLTECSFAVFLSALPSSPSPPTAGPRHTLHSPLLEAQLLSLSGITCFLTNQWGLDPRRCTQVYKHLMKGLFNDGKTISTAYWDAVHSSNEQQQQQHQQQQQQHDAGEEVHLSPADAQNPQTPLEASSVYNCVLYGLPHVNYTSPQS